MTGATDDRFAEVYNDREKFPTLQDVALELNISYQTVRNRSSVLRGKLKRGDSVPELISRVVTKTNREEFSPTQHAENRANALSEQLKSLFGSTRYPVINPEALIVQSSTVMRYDRLLGHSVEKETTPRTWVTDTLRVEGVENKAGRTFIFTGAQNDAEIHEGFWNNLKAYANHLDADIVVGAWTYESNWWAENNPATRSYDPRLAEYLAFGQMAIGDDFVFCGEMNNLPTASRPISDLQTYTCGKWGVFPHAKVQLKSIPSTDPRMQARQVMTTGAVTIPKVIPRKAGVKSIFHHVIGAVLVEFDQDGDIFCRHLLADDDGSFYDLDLLIKDETVTKHSGVDGITFADIHMRKFNRDNFRASFGFEPDTMRKTPESLMEVLNPKEIFIHDLFDNETRNHHHIGDNAYSYDMAYRETDSVLDEVKDCAVFLSDLQKHYPNTQTVVVESNHDIGLTRYICEGRYRNDGINIRFGLQMEDAYLAWREEVSDALAREEAPPTFSMLEYAIAQLPIPTHMIEWVHDGQSRILNGVECGHHGFRGVNGAKGTVAGFARIGRKMTIADKHSSEIMDGVCVAGTMHLSHGYNKGPSGWTVSQIAQYPNGKRAMITYQNGKFRATR